MPSSSNGCSPSGVLIKSHCHTRHRKKALLYRVSGSGFELIAVIEPCRRLQRLNIRGCLRRKGLAALEKLSLERRDRAEAAHARQRISGSDRRELSSVASGEAFQRKPSSVALGEALRRKGINCAGKLSLERRHRAGKAHARQSSSGSDPRQPSSVAIGEAFSSIAPHPRSQCRRSLRCC